MTLTAISYRLCLIAAMLEAVQARNAGQALAVEAQLCDLLATTPDRDLYRAMLEAIHSKASLELDGDMRLETAELLRLESHAGYAARAFYLVSDCLIGLRNRAIRTASSLYRLPRVCIIGYGLSL